MKNTRMGHTRVGRFAAVTVPATAVSLAFGVAILQGSVSAALASSSGFEISSTSASADGLQLSLAGTSTATSDTDTTSANKEAALVTLENGSLNGMCLAADATIPLLGQTLGLKIEVPNLANGGTAVDVGTLDLNAKSIDAGQTDLPGTTIGIAEDDLRRNDPAALSGLGAFGMQTNNATGEAAGDVSLASMSAEAYMLNLTDGLALSSLSIVPELGGSTCTVTP